MRNSIFVDILSLPDAPGLIDEIRRVLEADQEEQPASYRPTHTSSKIKPLKGKRTPHISLAALGGE